MNLFIKQSMLNMLLGRWKQRQTEVQDIRTLIGLALAHNMVLEIEYTDKQADHTVRAVEPVTWDEVNVLTHCRLREGRYRKFTINYILSARWTGELFVPQEADQKAPTGASAPSAAVAA